MDPGTATLEIHLRPLQLHHVGVALQRAQELKSFDLSRKLRGLDKVEKKELASLEESLLREARTRARGGRNQMPSLGLDLSPPGRKAPPHKAKNRHKHKAARDRIAQAHSGKPEPKQLDLMDDFEKAADDGSSGSSGKGSTEGQKPKLKLNPRVRRYGRRRKDKDKDNDLDYGR